jgi:hypothetical protein
MQERLRQAVFSVEAARFDWADVLLAAHLSGEWPALETEIRQGLACLTACEDEESEEAAPEAETLDSASAEFRYARDLVTAEEFEAWLAAHGLTAGAWQDYIERSVLRAECTDRLDDLVEAYAVTSEDVWEVLWVEGVCSGRLAQLAQALAARVAAAEEGRSDPAGADAQRGSLPELPGLPPDECRDRLARLAPFEAGFECYRRAVVTPEAVRDQVAAHRLDWIRLEGRYLSFDDESAAREAVLMLREDGLGLEEVAETAALEVRDARLYVDGVAPDARDRFLAARRGEVLGPVALGEAYAVFAFDDKVLPTPEDPEVRQRAEAAVLHGRLDRLVADRVRWHVTL